MQKNVTIALYISILVVILIVGGLAGWYLFLKKQTDATNQIGAGRGLDSAVPSFTGEAGSTYENVAQTVVEDTSAVDISNTNTGATKEPPALWRVSQNPTAGMGFVQGSASVAKLNFVERASGNIFSANLETGRIDRLTNTLFPKTYLATFASDGAVLLRSADVNGKTTLFAGTIPPKPLPKAGEIASSSPVALKGEYLAENISSLTVNPKAHEIFYILPDSKVPAIGIRSGWDGTAQKHIFDSGIAGWQTLWLADGRIVLTQKPAYGLAGSAYSLDTSGTLTPIIRGIPGLTLLPRSGSKNFVYGTATDGTINLYVKKDKKDPELLPVKTLADKCVWSPKQDSIIYCAVPKSVGIGNFIDPWIQGRFHTSDVWWEVNVTDNTAHILLSADGSSNSFDAIQPTIDATGGYISFINGSDLSLWTLRIPTATSTSH